MPTLHWIGKEKVINHHMDVPFKILEHKYGYENGTQSEHATNSGNKIIHGDNLEALKALLPEYEGKIKCIYIDPPYNTGEESWVYNDNVNDPKIKKWLHGVVGKEGEDLSRHDKWLCMMYPRLKLLHKLLSNDGVIFISIDDNEFANLKLVCDEIFGISNFVTNFIWEKRTNRENRKEISYRHDYILAYRKNHLAIKSTIKLLPMSGEALERYKNPDSDPRGPWKSDPATAQAGHATASQFYTLIAPNGKKHELQSGRCWVYTEDVMREAIGNNEIWFGKDGNGVPRIKTFLKAKSRGLVPETIWFAEDVGTNETAKVDLKSLFDGAAIFQTPKPYQLIERILQISTEHDSIVLDSFSGSGTTGQSVLNLNKLDGGTRKFILIEMENYAETVTAERIKRAISSHSTTQNGKGCFDFYELGQPMFLEDGNLNELVGEEKIKQYVYYTETQKPLSISKHKDNRYFLDKHNDTAYYFYYEADGITTLDHAFLATMKTKAEQYIIYADNCLLTKGYMSKHNIIFKKIPRDITKF
ncbi:MAG: site-specific DNA-methyltransferase [Flavipsychrobacter sp.]